MHKMAPKKCRRERRERASQTPRCRSTDSQSCSVDRSASLACTFVYMHGSISLSRYIEYRAWGELPCERRCICWQEEASSASYTSGYEVSGYVQKFTTRANWSRILISPHHSTLYILREKLKNAMGLVAEERQDFLVLMSMDPR
jgi:hypothetical protein